MQQNKQKTNKQEKLCIVDLQTVFQSICKVSSSNDLWDLVVDSCCVKLSNFALSQTKTDQQERIVISYSAPVLHCERGSKLVVATKNTLYGQKYWATPINLWIQVYKIKHRAMQSAFTNIRERMRCSKELAGFQCCNWTRCHLFNKSVCEMSSNGYVTVNCKHCDTLCVKVINALLTYFL